MKKGKFVFLGFILLVFASSSLAADLCEADRIRQDLERELPSQTLSGLKELARKLDQKSYTGKSEKKIRRVGNKVVVEILPATRAEAYHIMGFLLGTNALVKPALWFFLRAVEIEPDNPLYLSEAGGLLNFVGRSKAAECFFQEALRREPPPPALINAATYFSLSGNEEKAFSLFAEALKKAPQNELFQKLYRSSFKRLLFSNSRYRSLYQQIETLEEDVYRDCEETFRRANAALAEGVIPSPGSPHLALSIELMNEAAILNQAIPQHDSELFEIYNDTIVAETEAWERLLQKAEAILNRIDQEGKKVCRKAGLDYCAIQRCETTYYSRNFRARVAPLYAKIFHEHFPRITSTLLRFEEEGLRSILTRASGDVMELFQLYQTLYLYLGMGCKLMAQRYLTVAGNYEIQANMSRFLPACYLPKPDPSSSEESTETHRNQDEEDGKTSDKQRSPKIKIKLDYFAEFKKQLLKKNTEICLFGQCAGFKHGVAYLKFSTPVGVSTTMGFDVFKGKTVGGLGYSIPVGNSLVGASLGIEVYGSGSQGRVTINAEVSGLSGAVSQGVSLITVRTPIK